MKDPNKLTEVQDAIWDSKEFMPSLDDGTTYCNLATEAVLEAFGYNQMQSMDADQMMDFIRSSKDWLVKPIADCQLLVNAGTIIIAGLTSDELKQAHGHIMTLTPGEEGYSGHWDCKVPVGLSLGRLAICNRSIGVNYAFQPMPEFYALVNTL